MWSREEILEELLRSLARQGDHPTRSQIEPLADIGVRLRNECPDLDPALLRRMQRGWAALERQRHDTPSLSRGWSIVLRAASVLVTATLLLAALAWPPSRHGVQASLGRVINLFQQVRIEQVPAHTATPPPPPKSYHTFAGIPEAQAVTGFAIRVPSYLPAGLELERVQVAVDQGQERVILQYIQSSQVVAGARSSLFVQQFHSSQAMAGQAQTLQVDLQNAEQLDVAGRTALWIPHAGPQRANTLLVQDGEVLIQLYGDLSRAQSLQVAESLFE